MKTILEAEQAYREAELELKARRDKRSGKAGAITFAFAAGGILIFAVGVLLGLGIFRTEANSFLILAAVGAFFLAYAVFRIHMGRMRPVENDGSVDQAFDELEDAQKRWLQSAGFEATTNTIDELGFDLAPERYRDQTFGSAQLFHSPTGKVVPVVLKREIGKGYALYGPEGLLIQEHALKEGV